MPYDTKESDNQKQGAHDMSDKEGLVNREKETFSLEEDGENSATESFGEKSSDTNDDTETSEATNNQELGDGHDEDEQSEYGDSDINAASQKKQASEEILDEDFQEERNDHKDFLKNQEILLKNVIDHEKELVNLPKLRPCQSCEYLDPRTSETRSCCWGKMSNPCGKRRIGEFWIVSVPRDDNPQGVFDKLNSATMPQKLSINYKLHVPAFRIGTLDELLYVTGSLSKLENDAQRIIMSLVDFMKMVVGSNVRRFLETSDLDVVSYISKFTWNSAKYPDRRPLSVLKDIIRSQFRSMEENLRARYEEYNSLDKTLKNIEKQKTGGNLLTRSLADIVKKEDFVLGSRMLTTLLIVVPIDKEKRWNKKYHSLSEWIVPNSTVKLFHDKSHALYSVVIIKKAVEEFKQKAHKMKFQVRDFEYSDEAMAAEKNIQSYMEDLRRVEIDVLYRWMKVNFSESFAAWIHVKVMRVFAESVLRFGLKSGFQAMVLIPLRKKRLTKTLDKLYDEIDNDLLIGSMKDVPCGLVSLGGDVVNTKYVFLSISVDFILKKK